jgi:hypothetical protein
MLFVARCGTLSVVFNIPRPPVCYHTLLGILLLFLMVAKGGGWWG